MVNVVARIVFSQSEIFSVCNSGETLVGNNDHVFEELLTTHAGDHDEKVADRTQSLRGMLFGLTKVLLREGSLIFT